MRQRKTLYKVDAKQGEVFHRGMIKHWLQLSRVLGFVL